MLHRQTKPKRGRRPAAHLLEDLDSRSTEGNQRKQSSHNGDIDHDSYSRKIEMYRVRPYLVTMIHCRPVYDQVPPPDDRNHEELSRLLSWDAMRISVRLSSSFGLLVGTFWFCTANRREEERRTTSSASRSQNQSNSDRFSHKNVRTSLLSAYLALFSLCGKTRGSHFQLESWCRKLWSSRDARLMVSVRNDVVNTDQPVDEVQCSMAVLHQTSIPRDSLGR